MILCDGCLYCVFSAVRNEFEVRSVTQRLGFMAVNCFLDCVMLTLLAALVPVVCNILLLL